MPPFRPSTVAALMSSCMCRCLSRCSSGGHPRTDGRAPSAGSARVRRQERPEHVTPGEVPGLCQMQVVGGVLLADCAAWVGQGWPCVDVLVAAPFRDRSIPLIEGPQPRCVPRGAGEEPIHKHGGPGRDGLYAVDDGVESQGDSPGIPQPPTCVQIICAYQQRYGCGVVYGLVEACQEV